MKLVKAKVILDDIFTLKENEGYELHRKDGLTIYLKRITKEEWEKKYA